MFDKHKLNVDRVKTNKMFFLKRKITVDFKKTQCLQKNYPNRYCGQENRKRLKVHPGQAFVLTQVLNHVLNHAFNIFPTIQMMQNLNLQLL